MRSPMGRGGMPGMGQQPPGYAAEKTGEALGFMERMQLTSRALHLVSSMALSGSIVFDYMTDNALYNKIQKHRHFRKYHAAFGILLFATGVMNLFYAQKGKKLVDPVHKVWRHLLEFKFVAALFMTPLIYPLTSMFAEEEGRIDEKTRAQIQFYLVCVMFVYSSFLKYFREEVCHNFEKDAIMEKVQQLQSRFSESAKHKDGPLDPLDGRDPAAAGGKTEAQVVQDEMDWMKQEQAKFQNSRQGGQGGSPAAPGGTGADRAQPARRMGGQTGGTEDSVDIKAQLREIQKKEAELAARLGQYADMGIDVGAGAGRGAATQGAKRAPQPQARPPARGQTFDEDYEMENPRIETEGDELDAYGEEIMRQMRAKQQMSGGPLGAGMYNDDAGGDSDYGQEIDVEEDLPDDDGDDQDQLDGLLKQQNDEAEAAIIAKAMADIKKHRQSKGK